MAAPLPESGVELFSTSTASSIKTKKDCNRLRALLVAKKIPFVEVDLADQPFRRREMLRRSNFFDTLPQLHAYGKFIGDLAQVQELEDFGELLAALEPPPIGPDPRLEQPHVLPATVLHSSSAEMASSESFSEPSQGPLSRQPSMPTSSLIGREGSVLASQPSAEPSAEPIERGPSHSSASDDSISGASDSSPKSVASEGNTQPATSPEQANAQYDMPEKAEGSDEGDLTSVPVTATLNGAQGESSEAEDGSETGQDVHSSGTEPASKRTSQEQGEQSMGIYRAADRVAESAAEQESGAGEECAAANSAAAEPTCAGPEAADQSSGQHQAASQVQAGLTLQELLGLGPSDGSKPAVKPAIQQVWVNSRGRFDPAVYSDSDGPNSALETSDSNSSDAVAELVSQISQLHTQEDVRGETDSTQSECAKPQEHDKYLDWAFDADEE